MKTTEPIEAIKGLISLFELLASGIFGSPDHRGPFELSPIQWDFEFRWHPAWAMEVTIRIDPKEKSAKISFSSSMYSPASAIAKASIIRKVAEFGCLCESHMSGWNTSRWPDFPSEKILKGVNGERISLKVP